MPTFLYAGQTLTISTLYSYARVSSSQSTIEAGGEGIPRQIELHEEFAGQFGIATDDLTGLQFIDEAKSGSKGAHLRDGAALAAFMARAKNKQLGKNPGLTVESFSRLSRLPIDLAMRLFLDVINAGVTLITLVDHNAYNEESVRANAGQIYQVASAMQAARAMAEATSDYSTKSWRMRRGTATALCPSWMDRFVTPPGGQQYQVTGFKGAPKGALLDVQPNPVKHAMWQRIITDVLSSSVETLAKTYNREGIPPFSGTGNWNPAGLAGLIRGRMGLGEQAEGKYTGGKRTRTGTIHKNAYPAVITEDQWLLANAAMDSRKKGVTTGRNVTKWSNLFGALAVCDRCGGRMKIKQRGRVGQFKYMACANAGIGKCSVKRYFRLDRVEAHLFEYIDALKDWSQPVAEDRPASIRSQIAEAKAKAADIEAAYERSMLRTGPLAEKTQLKLEADHADKLDEIKLLERELAMVLRATPAEDTIDGVRALLPGLAGLKRPALIDARGHIAQALPNLLPGGLRFLEDGAVRVMRDGYAMELEDTGAMTLVENDPDDNVAWEDRA